MGVYRKGTGLPTYVEMDGVKLTLTLKCLL